jgi:hypothetical protein
MKNCLSGGKHMTSHMRVTKKGISESRLKKLMKKKRNQKYGQADQKN